MYLVTFYAIGSTGKPEYPVLYLDTLKVSTIEQSASQSTANGGKGNPELITWDFGKEITVTIEDALFSAKSMAIMFGNGNVKSNANASNYVMRTVEWTCSATETAFPSQYEMNGKVYSVINAKYYKADATSSADAQVTSPESGTKYLVTFDLAAKDVSLIEISANSFPGTYYVTGDTYARSAITGADEYFQFVIPKAKMQPQNTITLQAEGDPSVFNMSLRVMRPETGPMMMLVKYDLDGSAATEVPGTIAHNHELVGQ